MSNGDGKCPLSVYRENLRDVEQNEQNWVSHGQLTGYELEKPWGYVKMITNDVELPNQLRKL